MLPAGVLILKSLDGEPRLKGDSDHIRQGSDHIRQGSDHIRQGSDHITI